MNSKQGGRRATAPLLLRAGDLRWRKPPLFRCYETAALRRMRGPAVGESAGDEQCRGAKADRVGEHDGGKRRVGRKDDQGPKETCTAHADRRERRRQRRDAKSSQVARHVLVHHAKHVGGKERAYAHIGDIENLGIRAKDGQQRAPLPDYKQNHHDGNDAVFDKTDLKRFFGSVQGFWPRCSAPRMWCMPD